MSVTDTANKVRHRLVVQEIAAERCRQMEVEGWTPHHDDAHTDGSMAQAAGCYALVAGGADVENVEARYWPASWAPGWFKPKGRRRDLIRAAALIVAEVERIDRSECAACDGNGGGE